MCLGWPDSTWRGCKSTEVGVLAPPWNMSLQVFELAKQCFIWGCHSSLGSAHPYVAAMAWNIRGIACRGNDEPPPKVRDSREVRPWNPLTSFWVWENWGPDTNIVEHRGLSLRQGERQISVTLWALCLVVSHCFGKTMRKWILKENGFWVKPMHN